MNTNLFKQALIDFKKLGLTKCPNCGLKNIPIDKEKKHFRCERCGKEYNKPTKGANG